MDKLDIVTDESGNKVVLLPEIIFSNKQNINWDDVEDYLGKYVGELIEIAETRDIIYLETNFRMNMAVLVIQEKQRAQEQKQRQMRHRESEKWLR